MQGAAALALITELSAPLSPLQSYGGLLDERDQAIAAASVDDVRHMIPLLGAPPSAGMTADETEAWNWAVVDAIAQFGRRAPARIVAMLEPVAKTPALRPLVIAAVGRFDDQAVVPFLRGFVEVAHELPGEDIEVLAAALARIGGTEAITLLTRLATQTAGSDEVRASIVLALKLVELPRSTRAILLLPGAREVHEAMAAAPATSLTEPSTGHRS
jgi:hypothetical protein